MKYRLLVVDIDGTLLGSEGGISAEDKEALSEARRAGTMVCIATGRALQSCRPIIKELSLDGHHIFFDGALISGPDGEIYVEPLDRGVVGEAVEFAQKNKINLELYSSQHYFIEQSNWGTDINRHYFHLEPKVVDFKELVRERIIKGGLISRNEGEAAKARSFRTRFDLSLRFSLAKSPAFPGVEFTNIVAPGVSKGKALTKLAAHLGIPLEEVAAIGDGPNDISLLSVAGLAVAMGNAVDEVMAVADRVTRSVRDSGVAAAIREFLL